MSEKNAYAQSGVDVEAGYEVVERIKKHVARTERAGVMGALGGFGGMFDLSQTGVKEPVLISGTDGVGTKLMLAIKYDKHDTIGQDCVAMCVNDIIAAGAEPLYFLDYVATGKNEPAKLEQVVAGVAEGCVQASAALIGGETAEMPGMYGEDDYDLAGFADDLAAEIDEDKVPVLPIFKALEKYGDIKHEEMFEIFNMGVGLMLDVNPENVDRVKELLDEPVYEIGRIIKKADDSVVIK